MLGAERIDVNGELHVFRGFLEMWELVDAYRFRKAIRGRIYARIRICGKASSEFWRSEASAGALSRLFWSKVPAWRVAKANHRGRRKHREPSRGLREGRERGLSLRHLFWAQAAWLQPKTLS